MKKALIATASLSLGVLIYACKDNSNTNPVTTGPVLLTSALTSQISSGSATSGTGTATGSFSGNLDQTSRVLSYTVTYSGINASAITLDPVSTSATSATTVGGSGTSLYNASNSILLAGTLPASLSNPSSGTSTSPGSGTSATPGSGTSTSPGSSTSTSPGSGTSTTPGSSTSTTPGSSTSTTPGSGTSTSPGSGTGVTLLTSPLSGTVSLTQSRADSIRNGYYGITIRSDSYPYGALTGTVKAQ